MSAVGRSATAYGCALLEIVSELAEDRVTAEREFRRAVVNARTHRFLDPETGKRRTHTLQEIGDAAGLSKQRVGQLLKTEREENGGR